MKKRRIKHPLLLLIMMLLFACKGFSQDSSSLFNRILSFPDKVFNRIDKEASSFEQKLNKQTEKYLTKLQRREEKLKRKLWKQDSAKAKEVFGDVKGRYDGLRNELKAQEDKGQEDKVQESKVQENRTQGYISTVYNGHLDSLGTAMKFLQNNPLLKEGDALTQKISTNLKAVSNLKNSLNQTEYIRKQVQERQQQLKAQLQNTGLAKEFSKYRKEVYYYQQQLREYKEALEDPKKFGNKLLETAMKFPAFQEFFRKNSQLASMFRLPGGTDPANMQSFAGLQTRADVQNILQQRFGTAAFTSPQGGAGGGYVQQQMQTAQNEIQKLKNKVTQWGGGDLTPNPSPKGEGGFIPNSQKTKSFLKRIEWGTNMQTSKGTLYFPVTSDIGLSAGFKLNDKSIIGIGASYKVGWGQNWQNIRITHQGAGLRTFVDWKLPLTLWGRSGGGFWISGGAEMNYRSEFKKLRELYSSPTGGGWVGAAWQQSALIGISKKYSIGKKWKGNAQMLYDFLWKEQRPRTQPVVFRIGYHF